MTQRLRYNGDTEAQAEFRKNKIKQSWIRQPLRATGAYFKMTGTDTDVKIVHKLTRTET